jgi:hypothetical protein
MSGEPMKPCLWLGLIFWTVYVRPRAFRIERTELPVLGIGVSQMFA